MFGLNATKKTVFCLSITTLLILCCYIVSLAYTTETYNFDSFTEADSMQFIKDNDIEIPLSMQDDEDLAAITQAFILTVYQDPTYLFAFGSSTLQTYANDIRIAVLSYMNSDNSVSSNTRAAYYALQDSTAWGFNGGWVNTPDFWYNSSVLRRLNCYAFALHRYEYPGHYPTNRKYEIGDMSVALNNTSFDVRNECDDVFDMAEYVRDDLEAMGFTNVQITNYIPSVNSSQELICLRTGSWTGPGGAIVLDYHFMLYDLETNAWYHKPGDYAILKYNYTPSNSRTWIGERVVGQTEARLYANEKYDSEIAYIRYSKNQISVPQTSSTRKYIQAQGNGPRKDILCAINVPSSGKYDLHITSTNLFDYELYDQNMNLIFSGSGNSIDKYWNASSGGYYLRINFVSNPQYSYVDIHVSTHSHSYGNSYVWYNYTQHKPKCDCGFTGTVRAHVISSNPSPGQYATCLHCGGPASRGISIMNHSAEPPHSPNGSYVLPNGIIVLVDKDIQLYMSGTLTFTSGECD